MDVIGEGQNEVPLGKVHSIQDRLHFLELDGFVAQILARDSRSESRLVTGSDEQAEAHALPNDELVHLQRGAEEAWITDGVV